MTKLSLILLFNVLLVVIVNGSSLNDDLLIKQQEVLLQDETSSSSSQEVNSELVRMNDEFETEKERYFQKLRAKLGLWPSSQSANRFEKRRRPDTPTLMEYLQKKRGYYTRPCLVNAISCYFYG